MSQPVQHNKHHRAREENAVQRRIMDRITEVQGKHRRHRNHPHEDAIILHHDPDFHKSDVSASSTGTPIGRLVVPGSQHMMHSEDSVEAIVHYDMHPLMDKHPFLQEHFYEKKPPHHSNHHPHKHQDPKHRHKGAHSRAQSLPPAGGGRRRSGANFLAPPMKTFEAHSLHNSDSKIDMENEEETKYDSNEVPKSEGLPAAERRHSGSSNGSNSNKKDNRLQIPVETNESMDDFTAMDISPNSEGDSPADICSYMDRDKSQEYTGDCDDCNRVIGKKVSYSLEFSDDQLPTVPVKSHGKPIRLRTDCVENDDSEMNLEIGIGNRARRQASLTVHNTNRSFLNAPGLGSNGSDSQSNIELDIADLSGNKRNNKMNNNPSRQLNTTSSNASMHYSQDSLHGMGRKASNLYTKDVLPLPIEIPESVADAEAFRRYLSVRRGAISSSVNPNQSFENRKEPSSYDSLGRRNGVGQALGVTPSQRLSQEASRRTASLSHAIMTLALLSASICQLRFLITYSHSHSYPVLNYFLIFTSIILEVAAGIGYVMIARCSYDDAQAEYIHNYLIFALFIVAVSNVVLAAFAFDDHICEDMKKTNGPSSAATSQQNQQINQPMPRDDRVMDLRYMPLE